MAKNTHLIFEGFDAGDLHRMVDPLLDIDRYSSKMGDDRDVVVLSVLVYGESASNDLVEHIEKTFNFVLDADVSNSEDTNGYYTVFVELERRHGVCDKILDIISNVLLLTTQPLKSWKFSYMKSKKKYPLNVKIMEKIIPETPSAYDDIYNKEDTDKSAKRELEEFKLIAGLPLKEKSSLSSDPEIARLQTIARGLN